MVGKTLGHYLILEPLGAGSMGEVYLGEDTRLGRKLAIKVLPEEFGSCIRPDQERSTADSARTPSGKRAWPPSTP